MIIHWISIALSADLHSPGGYRNLISLSHPCNNGPVICLLMVTKCLPNTCPGYEDRTWYVKYLNMLIKQLCIVNCIQRAVDT